MTAEHKNKKVFSMNTQGFSRGKKLVEIGFVLALLFPIFVVESADAIPAAPVSFSSTEFVGAVVGEEVELRVTVTGISSDFAFLVGNGAGTLSAGAINDGISDARYTNCYFNFGFYGACNLTFRWTPKSTAPLQGGTHDTFTFQIRDQASGLDSVETISFTGTAQPPPPCYTVSGTTLISGSACTGAVTIAPGITSISNQAFLSNQLITSVTIPDSVVTIGAQAFQQCPLLTSVVLPSNITDIPFAIFLGSPQLANIGAIPNRVTSIGEMAFKGTALTTLNIPNSVTTLGASFASDMSLLTTVTFGSGITAIPSNAFAGSGSLQVVNIPANVTSIGSGAFLGSMGITSLTLPDTLTSIGSQAFDGAGPPNLSCVNASLASFNLYLNSWAVGITRCAPPVSTPTITSISPESGPTAGGTLLSITGTGFLPLARVYLGEGIDCEVETISDTTITCKTPLTFWPDVYGVTVVNDDGGYAVSLPGFTYLRSTPTITSVSPNSGTIAGGTPITITGTGFFGDALVYFYEEDSPEELWRCVDVEISTTTITCKTPISDRGGRFSIYVVNEDGGDANLRESFSYQRPRIYFATSFRSSLATAEVTTGYSTGTSTTITLERGGNYGSNPTILLDASAGGTWSISAGENITLSDTTVTAGVAVTLTLTGASGTFTMSLNPGSPVGTYYPIVNERNLFSVTVTAAVTAPPPPPAPPAPRQVVEQIPEPKLTAITPIVEKQSNPYVTLNGAETSAVVQANTSQNGMEVVANGWGLSLAVIEPNGNPAPLSPNRSLVLNEDQQVRVSGPGFKPNTEVHVYLFSTPRLIGTTTTDSNGNFIGIFPMLKDVAVGNHLIQVNGISPDNQVRSTTLPAIYEKAKSPITPTINNLVFVVPFSSNKYTLNNSQMAILKSIKQVKAAKIQVIGFAQSSAAQADIALSLDRALEVKKAVSKIVPKANFITRGSGSKSQPLCAKYKNKCVVVTITQG